MKKFQVKNIPNLLTVVRILFLFPIILLIFLSIPNEIQIFEFKIEAISSTVNLNFFLAGFLFLISALTDALDGFLARKYNWISQFGKIWDPIADKVIINSVLVALSIEKDVPFYIPIILIIRDTVIDAYRLSAISEKKDISANNWGKIKTIFLFFGILIIFFIFNFPNTHLISKNWQYFILQNGVLHLATIFAIFSSILYIKEFHIDKKLQLK